MTLSIGIVVYQEAVGHTERSLLDLDVVAARKHIGHLAHILHTVLVRQFGKPGDVAVSVIDGGKGILANLLNVGRDGHVFQSAASRECLRTYLLHLVAHSDGSQFFTSRECSLADFHDIGRDVDGL